MTQHNFIVEAPIAVSNRVETRDNGLHHAPGRNGSGSIANSNGHGKLNGTPGTIPATSGNGALALREVDIMRSLAPLKASLQEVEDEIERLVTASVKSVADVASHTLGAGGKRLRPALTILASQLCDGGRDTSPLTPKVLSGAVAVELTHTTTLLHDDVVDSAEVRRGKPAANLIWGNGMSVLVGDYLFAQVFLIASQKGFVDLMHPLAEATSQMCAGELLEVQKRGSLDMSEQDYQEIVALKTASLTECSCRIGALAVDATEETCDRLARYGHLIGLAFQIVDDVFDITSSRGRIGKPVGNDIREGVITLPMLRAMQLCGEADKATLQELIGKSPIEDDDVERALQILRFCGAPQSAMQTALEHVAMAKLELQHFAPCPAHNMLCDIADYVVSRDK